jgi:hypothetical protein
VRQIQENRWLAAFVLEDGEKVSAGLLKSGKELKIDRSLYEILQVLSVNIFERTQVNQLFAEFDCKSCKD